MKVKRSVYTSEQLYCDVPNFTDTSEATFTANLTAIAAPKLEAEIVFTSPRAGFFTVPSRNGFRYELLRSPDLPPSSLETIIDTANGLGGPLILGFDDRHSSPASALFFIREVELSGPFSRKTLLRDGLKIFVYNNTHCIFEVNFNAVRVRHNIGDLNVTINEAMPITSVLGQFRMFLRKNC